jgi:uncharacterized protein
MTEPTSQLDPKITLIWRLGRTIRLIFGGIPFLLFFCYILFMIMEDLFGDSTATFVTTIVGGLFFLRSLIYALVWPTLEYRFFRFELRGEDLIVQQGVLFRQWAVVPRHRIQHVDTSQGPLERMMGLASLRVYTAAGISADGSIPGLPEKMAEGLRDELSRSSGDDGV